MAEIFNERQRKIIKEAESRGLDTTDLTKTYKYANIGGSIFRQTGLGETATIEHENPVFSELEMEEILRGLIDGVNVKLYTITKPEHKYRHIIEEVAVYNAEQMREIRLGLKQGIDVLIYLSSSYNANQMREIRLGLLEGLNAKVYASPENDATRMNILRQMLRIREVFITKYGNAPMFRYTDLSYGAKRVPVYRTEQLIQILQGMLQGLPYDKYDSFTYTADQMEEIRLGLLKGVDLTEAVRPSDSSEEMREIRFQMQKEGKLTLKQKKQY